MTSKTGRRRPPRTKTERAESVEACAAHLRDLRRAHRASPPDVALASRSVPERPEPAAVTSGCASPGLLCAELLR